MKNLAVPMTLFFGVCSLPAQTVELIYVQVSQTVFQSGPETFIPIEDKDYDEWTNFRFTAGITPKSETITNALLKGPATPPEGSPLVLGDDEEYGVELQRDNLSGLAGTYTFTGTGSSVGPFSVNLTLEPFNSITPPRVTSYTELQGFNPDEPQTIEWAPFPGLQNPEDGLIFVTVGYFGRSGAAVVWSAEEDPEAGDFGGIPSNRTSVTVPAGLIVGSEDGEYVIVIDFLKLDWKGEPAPFPGAMMATALSSMTVVGAKSKSGPEINTWYFDGSFGWIYELGSDWGFSYGFGYIYKAHLPSWVYQNNLGWLAPVSGRFEAGIWLYGPDAGWVYTTADWGSGWYSDPFGVYNNMIEPLPLL